MEMYLIPLTLLHSEWPKLHRVLAILSAIGLRKIINVYRQNKYFLLRFYINSPEAPTSILLFSGAVSLLVWSSLDDEEINVCSSSEICRNVGRAEGSWAQQRNMSSYLES